MTRNVNLLKGLPLLIPLVLLCVSCSDEDGMVDPADSPDPFEVRQIPAEILQDLSPVVEGNTAFALDLYAYLAQSGGNLIFSPYSISTALAMTWAGARGVTEAEMAEVFRFTLGQERLHPVFGALQNSLQRGADLDGYEVSIANRLWGREGYPWLEPFLRVTREDYGAELKELDFAGQTEESRLIINQWVEEKTRGKIEELFRRGVISSNTVLVLTNAIYFKGAWASPFDEDLTAAADFRVAPGVTVEVPMMQQHAEFAFFHDDEITVLRMPYEGEDLSMIFLSPNAPDGLAALEARLSPEDLTAWLAASEVVEVDVWLPRFKFPSEFVLNDVLMEMGMPSAFTPGADFSGMNGSGGIWISTVIHKAVIEVNEEGAEAAAATGVVMTDSVKPTFNGNHPFIFLIYDHLTESVLFLGRVVDPS